jgi:hypothetical protein
MNIKDCTRTKGGHKVRIYADDAGGTYPVHGAIYNPEEKIWGRFEWTSDGYAYAGKGDSLYNLDLTDWRDEIPWECIRDEVNWVYTHYDGGAWRASIEEPCEYNGFRDPANGRCFALGAIKMPTPPADWREAIARRPGR